ncbi:hypothetical protein ACSFA8_22885 [Variovorax sp. RT4R15]|uniref:hypothetical protein n=1 Tax=Variovorax sp. RT4R15 TaxID=3443737 RepID=UPI003F44AFC7
MSKRSPLSIVQLAGTVLTFLTAGCVVQPPPPVRYATVRPVHVAPAAPPVVSVYVEPPLYQPPPIAVAWAPPPMLVETPPPLPFADAIWTGGYWTWQGNWVWAAGRWAAPPQPGYGWVQPYYEHRDGAVVFITGHWSPPGIAFVPPPLGLSLTVAAATVGVVAGLAPIGPQGVFVPAPPGSRLGLIVPAPIGTPPAVVVSAPPVTNVGMRVQNTTINNVSNTTNVTNVTNINNTRTVTVVAPASATASGRPFEVAVPAIAHLAAALPPVVRAMAPVPASVKPIAAFVPVHQQPTAPRPPEAVHAAPTPTPPVSAAQAQARPQAALSFASAKQAEPGRLAAPARPNAEPPKKAMPAIDEPRPPRADPELRGRARQASAQRIASEQETSHSLKQEPTSRVRPAAPPHAHAEPRPAPREHTEPHRKEEHRE